MGSILKSLIDRIKPMKKFRVVLNIGHSEKQGGASSPQGTSEWNFNRRLAELIVQFAEGPVSYAIVTQSESIPLVRIPDIINQLSPVLVISLHANAFDKKTSGSEVLYVDRADLADKLLNSLFEALGLKLRGIKKLKEGDRGFFLIDSCNSPCLILEPFFIDNQEDYNCAQKHIQVLAQKLAQCISMIVSNEPTLTKRYY